MTGHIGDRRAALSGLACARRSSCGTGRAASARYDPLDPRGRAPRYRLRWRPPSRPRRRSSPLSPHLPCRRRPLPFLRARAPTGSAGRRRRRSGMAAARGSWGSKPRRRSCTVMGTILRQSARWRHARACRGRRGRRLRRRRHRHIRLVALGPFAEAPPGAGGRSVRPHGRPRRRLDRFGLPGLSGGLLSRPARPRVPRRELLRAARAIGRVAARPGGDELPRS